VFTIYNIIQAVMKREQEVQQGQKNRISSDNYMVRSVHVVVRYTKIHIRFQVLISGKLLQQMVNRVTFS
jgi:hypothetical protein